MALEQLSIFYFALNHSKDNSPKELEVPKLAGLWFELTFLLAGHSVFSESLHILDDWQD